MSDTILITGANRGLGLEFARQCAARGDLVIGTCRSIAEASELKAIAKQVIPLDVADEQSVEALALAMGGQPIDILINNAGVMGQEPSIERVTHVEMARIFMTNAVAPAVLMKALIPSMIQSQRKPPMVLNISSTLGSIASAMPGFSYSYCASKAALNMITALAAKELKPAGIAVFTFCPGWNKTDMGGPNAPLNPADSIRSLLAVANRLSLADSGQYLSHEGKPIPW
jgi:NAD(P)-dependent dehydrogenase (short-subunit alcohol dehydrogenase family)